MLDINIWEIVLYIVNIVILFFFLRWLLYKPVAKFLNNRTDSIQKQLNEAAKKQAEAEQEKAKYNTMMADAQDLAAQMISWGKKTAEDQAQQIVSDAESQAREIRERADRYIEEQTKQAVLEMRGRITEIAIQIAEKILEREVSYEDNKPIIDDFFRKVG